MDARPGGSKSVRVTDDHRQSIRRVGQALAGRYVEIGQAIAARIVDEIPGYRDLAPDVIADGDWTCSVAHFTGTMTGPMKGSGGSEIPPTGKSFEVDFCTVARWDDEQIVEENLFYDLVTFMKQIGLS